MQLEGAALMDVYIYEVDVEAEGMRGVTYDVYLLHDDGVRADEEAARAAIDIFEETYGRGVTNTEVSYVGGVHPIEGPTVISVHEQR